MSYYKFTEHNDNEGETWHFFIPVEDNKEDIQNLKTFLEGLLEKEYEISDKIFTDDEVEILCDNTDSGYMDFNNQLFGKLVLPKLEMHKDGYIEDDPLYKGGIENFMEK